MSRSEFLLTSKLSQRQPQDDGCASTEFAVVFNPTTMTFEDILDNRHAETNTEILGTEHWLKNPVEYVLAHSRAIVLDNYLAVRIDKSGPEQELFVRLVNFIECLQG